MARRGKQQSDNLPIRRAKSRYGNNGGKNKEFFTKLFSRAARGAHFSGFSRRGTYSFLFKSSPGG
jgi:hypothetical protein